MREGQRRGRPLEVCLAVIASSSLILAGCGKRSISGSYVAHAGNKADLLQLTESGGHRLAGTFRHIELTEEGTLASTNDNLSGSVDGDSITLRVMTVPLPGGENVSGIVTDSGIDLMVGEGAQTHVEHLTKGRQSDFSDVVGQLERAGRPLVAAYQRKKMVDELDQQANILINDLNQFVANANGTVDRLARAGIDCESFVSAEQAKLDQAQRTQNSNRPLAHSLAFTEAAVIEQDIVPYLRNDYSFEREQAEEKDAEDALNARIDQWRRNCSDSVANKAGVGTPDVASCALLSHAVTEYEAALSRLRDARISAGEVKERGEARLAAILQAARKLE